MGLERLNFDRMREKRKWLAEKVTVMSIASAERRVQRLNDQLRIAREELRQEREKVSATGGVANTRRLEVANEPLKRFCDEYLVLHPDEFGMGKLPIRMRYVLCALAADVSRTEIAAALPLLNGQSQFVRLGLTKQGLYNIIRRARSELERINREKKLW